MKLRIVPILLVASVLPLTGSLMAAEAARPNLLFIIVDQLRYDAMGCAGNKVIKTPNMDRIASEGVRFTRAYAGCPVCAPARAIMLTGSMNETNRVTNNKVADIGGDKEVPNIPTFDQILMRNGYYGEFHGKWHDPYKWALNYNNAVRPLNGNAMPPGSRATTSDSGAFSDYIDAHFPMRPLRAGELISNRYGRAYIPSPIDPSYSKREQISAALRESQGAGQKSKKGGGLGSSQGDTYGVLVDIPEDCTLAAFTALDGLEALDRIKKKGGSFTLTISMDPPHPPFVASKKYFDMYPAAKMPVPSTIHDPRTNSPYLVKDTPGPDNVYGNPQRIQEGLGIYFALVTETDAWIGKILNRLDQLDLAKNTLVILTADHGEMMGEHGMHSKNIFYDGAARIPFILRLPGVIPAGKIIDAPISQVDYFATILDYCKVTGQNSEGKSVKPLIDGTEDGKNRIAYSEWPDPKLPGFMVFDGRWKLMFGRAPEDPSLDALYDLSEDPDEMKNLLGSNPSLGTYRAQAERLKALLVDRLVSIKSSAAATVKARPISAQAGLVPRAGGKKKTEE